MKITFDKLKIGDLLVDDQGASLIINFKRIPIELTFGEQNVRITFLDVYYEENSVYEGTYHCEEEVTSNVICKK